MQLGLPQYYISDTFSAISNSLQKKIDSFKIIFDKLTKNTKNKASDAALSNYYALFFSRSAQWCDVPCGNG